MACKSLCMKDCGCSLLAMLSASKYIGGKALGEIATMPCYVYQLFCAYVIIFDMRYR